MIEYIMSSLAWSLGGMVCGYLLARVEIEKASLVKIREQDDDPRASTPSSTD